MRKTTYWICAVTCVLLCSSCQSFLVQAPGLSTWDEYPETNSTVTLLNAQVKRYNKMIGTANSLLSHLDGRKRRFSWGAVGSKGVAGGLGIASAALTAANPAANAVWLQGLTATTTGMGMVTTEMHAQQLTAMAFHESLRLTAGDIMEALDGLRFDDAYGFALSADAIGFAEAYAANRAALSALEHAVVLKPLTHRLVVDEPGAEDDELRAKRAREAERARDS